jgi:thioredoxin reductase (NADPH)
MHDCIIIGAGPAGLTATLYAKRYGMDVIVFNSSESLSSLATATTVENWPGIKSTSGPELIKKMLEQVKALEVEVKNQTVKSIVRTDSSANSQNKGSANIVPGFILTADKEYEAKTIIIATGMKNMKAGIKGEKEFLGKGVSYCIPCDAPLFSNKVVAVIGSNRQAVKGAIMLKHIADKVYLVHESELDAEHAVIEHLKGVKLIKGKLTAINGSDIVESITIDGKTLNVNGVFLEIGHIPLSGLVKELDVKTENSFIITDNKQATSVKGVFAAGDVTVCPLKQITTAVGQGAIAATSAFEYVKNCK